MQIQREKQQEREREREREKERKREREKERKRERETWNVIRLICHEVEPPHVEFVNKEVADSNGRNQLANFGDHR